MRQARSEHPNSAGGFSGTLTEYDIMGRVKRSTVPTEVNNSWTPSGDDASRGWLWSSQEYDWKGRVVRQINTDGTDKLISYEGCGCAGGQVTTVQGELVPRDDNPSLNARRTQKVYEDILGRSYKSETLSWNGTVYSTSKSFFNGRDQVTLQRQFAGADSSSTFQDTVATFDGYGRLKTQKRPEQDANTATIYNYFADDRIQQVVDARGATTNYVYDVRGLTTQVSTTSPNPSTIPVTPTVNYTYDNLGNRTQMTDGLGTQTYEYNQLSQLTAETRSFTDSLPNAPLANNSFRLEYSYSISGQLKSYKDPYNRQFDFGFDKAGRNTSIDGTAYAGVTNYLSNQQYRAFGSLKQVSYGNQTTATMTYNNRLQPNSYRLNDATQTLFGKDYFYTTANNNDNDGLLKKSVHYDATMSANEQAKRNQVNTYDAQGRIKTSHTGEPNLTPFGSLKNGHYQQDYTYDAFGNVTYKTDLDFGLNQIGCRGCPRGISYSETIVNNRTTSSQLTANGSPSQYVSNYQYDAEGQLVNRDGVVQNFDVAGQMVSRDATGTVDDHSFAFDGDGERVKWTQTTAPVSLYYYLRSSVFGGDLLQVDSSGAMYLENVYSPTGAKVAHFKNNEVFWNHDEPSGKEEYYLKQDRTATSKTFDPTGTPATSVGYNGGGPCPPQTCPSPENSTIPGPYTQKFDATTRLNEIKNEFREKRFVFDNLRFQYLLGVAIDYTIKNKPEPNGGRPPRLKNAIGRRVSPEQKRAADAGNTGLSEGPQRGIVFNIRWSFTVRASWQSGQQQRPNCDEHKKFLQQAEAQKIINNAWKDSNYGSPWDGNPKTSYGRKNQHEEFGLIFQNNGSITDARFPADPDNEEIHRASDRYDVWREGALANNIGLKYEYHTHPFKAGSKIPIFSVINDGGDPTKKMRVLREIYTIKGNDVYSPSSGGDFGALTPGSIGLLITDKKLILYNNEQVICEINQKRKQ